MNKAGHLAVCACCGGEFPEDQAHVDQELGGPVDQDCKRLLGWSQAYLKRYAKCKMASPNDLDENNHTRFV